LSVLMNFRLSRPAAPTIRTVEQKKGAIKKQLGYVVCTTKPAAKGLPFMLRAKKRGKLNLARNKNYSLSCKTPYLRYNFDMKHLLTNEIAMAIQKGERDYAQLLRDIEIEQAPKITTVHVDNLNKNQKQGYANLERRLRGAT